MSIQEKMEECKNEYDKKVSEYKPLAKVEELEEANYNQIDNILNNLPDEKPYEKKKKRYISMKQALDKKRQEALELDLQNHTKCITNKKDTSEIAYGR